MLAMYIGTEVSLYGGQVPVLILECPYISDGVSTVFVHSAHLISSTYKLIQQVVIRYIAI